MRIGRIFPSGQLRNSLGKPLCLHGVLDCWTFTDAIEVVGEMRPFRKIDAEALCPPEAGPAISISDRKGVAEEILVRRQVLVKKREPARKSIDDRFSRFLIEGPVEQRTECLVELGSDEVEP